MVHLLSDKFFKAWLITGQKFRGFLLRAGSSIPTVCGLSSYACQKFKRVARWGDRVPMKSPKPKTLEIPNIFWYKNQMCWPDIGPYCEVWAHIKTGWSHMAQDHFPESNPLLTPTILMGGMNLIPNLKSKKKKCWESGPRVIKKSTLMTLLIDLSTRTL